MQGNLKQIQLPEVLQFISMGKSTGLLTVRDKAGIETKLTIRSGRIINSSALERQRRLGDLLVHRGILKRSVLSQALRLQRTVDQDKRLGQILVDNDFIQESQIRDVLRLQLEEEIWNLFGLEEGEFKFEQVADDQIGEASVQIDIEPLLLEGTRRQDEWRKIIRVLPSDRLVLGVRRPELRPKKGGTMEEEDRKKPSYSPGEWKVLSQINGRFPIRAIINRAGMGRFEVYSILSEFLRRNVVFIKKQELAAPALPEQPVVAAAQPARGASGGGVTSLLSRLAGVARRDERQEKLSFLSPVGSLAYFATRLVEQFLAAKEYKPQPEDAALLEALWADILVSFPKADLIVAEKNRVNADRFESFMRLFEFKDSTRECFEDSIEGLLQLIEAAYRVVAQRVGDRVATRLVRELLEDIPPRSTHTHMSDFKLEERIQMVLRLTA